MKKVYYILSFMLLIGVLSYTFGGRIRCSFKNGDWTKVCLSQTYYCVTEYEDGGKICTSSKDCFGNCVKYSNKDLNYVCDRNNNPCGCEGTIENKPTIICAD